jgi:ABC-type phosphate transport system substrate-binding protein
MVMSVPNSRGRDVGAGAVPARSRIRWLLAALVTVVLALAPHGSAPAQSSTNLAVIVHAGVPVTSLNAVELASIYTRVTKTWRNGTTVRALNLLPGSPERVEFDRVVLDMSPERSAQFWMDKQIRGEEAAPKAIAQTDIVARLVPTLSGSIGYVPESKVEGQARVVARIRGGRVVAP